MFFFCGPEGAEEGKLNHLPSFRAMKDSRGTHMNAQANDAGVTSTYLPAQGGSSIPTGNTFFARLTA